MFDLLIIVLRSSLWLLFALGFVFGVRYFSRKSMSAKARYRLWVAVPIFVITGFLIDASRRFQFDKSSSESLPQVSNQIAQPDQIIYKLVEIPPSVELSAATQKLALILQNSSFINAIGMSWIIGFFFTALLFTYSQWAFHRKITPLNKTGSNVFQTNSCTIGPALVGFFKPKIIVPKDFTERYDPVEQALVLAHERTHLRRGDNFINAMVALIQSIFWFHPLVHLASRYIRIDQELACDSVVMATYPRHQKRYAKLLLKAEISRAKLPIGALWPAQSKTALKQRLLALGEVKQPAMTHKKWASYGFVSLICGAMIFSGARASVETVGTQIDT